MFFYIAFVLENSLTFTLLAKANDEKQEEESKSQCSGWNEGFQF